MNYIYGTWSVLCALNAAGFSSTSEPIRAAADWLLAIQNPDGGWGEDGTSYKLDYSGYERAPSTASQTAWALLGLMAAGRIDHPAVAGAYLPARSNAWPWSWHLAVCRPASSEEIPSWPHCPPPGSRRARRFAGREIAEQYHSRKQQYAGYHRCD
jgi:hypothetical protein